MREKFLQKAFKVGIEKRRGAKGKIKYPEKKRKNSFHFKSFTNTVETLSEFSLSLFLIICHGHFYYSLFSDISGTSCSYFM